VVPQLAERRLNDRRQDGARRPSADRRGIADRRILIGRRPVIGNGLDGGWLCFENQLEKRRLTPIPGDWQRCSAAELERYCQAAKRAPRPSTAAELNDIARIHHR
jgi:hypothetical protein